MPIRLSGINSGLDTDALVKELVSAYSLKTEKYEKEKTKIEWKKDAWQGLNTKIYGLYTSISNLRYDSAYNLKRTSVSDSTKAKVTAASDAVTGTQRLEIKATAQASYITGGRLDDNVTSKSTLADLGYTGGETSIEVRTKAGDVKEIKVTADTKISDLINQFKEAGLNASFDENNKRFFVSAKETGAANDFDLCATDADSQNVLSKLGLDLSLVELDNKGNKVFSSAGAAYQEALDLYEKSGGNIDTYIRTLIGQYKDELAAQEAVVEGHKDTIAEYQDLVAMRDARSAHNTIYSALANAEIGLSSKQVYNLTKEFKTGTITEEKVQQYLDDNGITLAEGKTAKDIATILNENKDNVKKVNAYEGNALSMKLGEIEDEISAKQADYDKALEETNLANAKIAAIKDADFAELMDLDEDALAAEIQELTDRALEAQDILANSAVSEDGAIKIVGQDAKIILNGAEFTSSSNSFSVNGLTIEAQAVTDEAISITTAVDTQGIYDKVKDFLTQYNSVINEITKLYNADSAKGYEPLTDEERDAMSETEIEKWEDKIKSSLLRRDSSLGSIMNAMINSMSQTFEVNGKKLSLSNFGISTLGFLNAAENEQYAFHIDGDEDDASTSGKPDKLMKAIQEDPDQIIGFLKQLTSSLYSAVDEKMKSTELSSVYKVYNDKEIDKEIKSMEDLIKKWQEKVEAEEERYYKQFSNMETALAKLQSQTNALSGMLGQ